jgi:hypothetical protein
MIWSKFSGAATVHAIILATAALAVAGERPCPWIAIPFSIVGSIVALFWVALTRRSFEYFKYCIDYCREMESKALQPMDFVTRGRDLTDGKRVIVGGVERKTTMTYRVEDIMNYVGFSFILLYLVVIGVALARIFRH